MVDGESMAEEVVLEEDSGVRVVRDRGLLHVLLLLLLLLLLVVVLLVVTATVI